MTSLQAQPWTMMMIVRISITKHDHDDHGYVHRNNSMGYVVGIDEGSSNMIVKSSVTGNHDPCPSTTLVIYTTFTKHYVTLLASSLTFKINTKTRKFFDSNSMLLFLWQ